MNIQRDKEIVDRIMEIDFMGTKEFCEKHNYPVPFYTGDVQSSAELFLLVDAKRWNVIKDFAKEVRRGEPNEKAQSAEEYIKDILGHDFSDRQALNAFCLAFNRYAEQKNASLLSHISDLEAQNQAFTDRTTQLVCQLNDEKALLEAKCRAYERALIEVTKTDWTSNNGKYFGKVSAQLHAAAITIAEQALKPKEDGQ